MGPYQRDPNTTCVNLKGTLLAIGTSLIFSLCMHWVGWELSANVVVRVRVGWSEVGSIGIGGVLAVGCVRESIIRYAIVEHLKKQFDYRLSTWVQTRSFLSYQLTKISGGTVIIYKQRISCGCNLLRL